MTGEVVIYELADASYKGLVQEYIDAYNTSVKLNKRRLEAKFRILIHLILQQQIASYDKETNQLGFARMNRRVMRETLAREVGNILELLDSLHLVRRVDCYIVGKHAFGYEVTTDYVTKNIRRDVWQTEFAHEEKIIQRINKRFRKAEQLEFQSYADSFCGGDTSFINRYAGYLEQLQVKQAEEISYYGDNQEYISKEQKDYYNITIDHLLKQYSKITFDDRGRIYHRLSSCAKDLRKFLNIDFEVDNHNSQPLLFALLLVKQYSIAPRLLDVFCGIIDDSYEVEGGRQPIVFNQDDSIHPFTIMEGVDAPNITREYIAELNKTPHDVWKYLYAVMTGCLWDMFVREGVLRDDAKKNLFKQVFYRRRTEHGFLPDVYGVCGNAFRNQFPNVTATITNLIVTHEKNWLPNEITRVESEIMRNILKKVWEHGLTAITIHDAVVVIKTPRRRKDSSALPKSLEQREQIVQQCFREVFREYHLLCSPAAEVYE